jgi:hypothetical protein
MQTAHLDDAARSGRRDHHAATRSSRRDRRAGADSVDAGERSRRPRRSRAKDCAARGATATARHLQDCGVPSPLPGAFTAAIVSPRLGRGKEPSSRTPGHRRSQLCEPKTRTQLTAEPQSTGAPPRCASVNGSAPSGGQTLAGSMTPGEFTREILPLIQNVPLRRLREATGLLLRYLSLVRRGERVPHPRHWHTLRHL